MPANFQRRGPSRSGRFHRASQGNSEYMKASAGIAQAGVFKKVAMDGIQPCSSSGVSTMPVQNIRCVWAPYSGATIRQLNSRLSR